MDEAHDVVVVGAGIDGLAAATGLARASNTVCLIETPGRVGRGSRGPNPMTATAQRVRGGAGIATCEQDRAPGAQNLVLVPVLHDAGAGNR